MLCHAASLSLHIILSPLLPIKIEIKNLMIYLLTRLGLLLLVEIVEALLLPGATVCDEILKIPPSSYSSDSQDQQPRG